MTVTDIKDLFAVGDLLDLVDIGGIVVETHFGPGEFPVIGVILGAERLMTLRVFSTTVAANPDVVAGVGELELERFFTGVGISFQPAGAVHSGAMLDEDRAPVDKGTILINLAEDLESCEDVLILSHNFMGFPVVAMLFHDSSKAGEFSTHLKFKFYSYQTTK